MPQKRNSSGPPKAMTWGGALPVLVIAAVFDLMRIFFVFFWLLGPAFAAIYCTAVGSDFLTTWTSGLLGTKTAAVACSVPALAGGFALSAFTTSFGVIMAMAVGFFGFLVLGLWISIGNARIFKVNATGSLWFTGALGVSQIPFLGALPVFSIVLLKLYKTQIRVEGEALKKYEREPAAAQLQERQRQAAQLMQAQAAEQAQFAQQEAANDEMYSQAEAANDEQYEIPEEVRRAA